MRDLAVRLRPLVLALAQSAGWSLAALAACLATAWLLDPLFAATGAALLPWPRLLLLNALPVALLLLMVLALTGRLLLSAALAFGTQAAVLVASSIKLEQLGLPLLPADFRFLSSGGGLTLFWHYVDAGQVLLLALLLVFALAALLLEPRRWGPRPLARGLLGLLALGGLASLWQGAAFWRQGYDGWNAGFEPWSPADTVARLGVAPTLLMFHWELARPDRQPPDRDRVLEFIAEHAQAFARSADREAAEVLPDIIVVQSESFFDPARLNGIEAGASLPHFRRLAGEGWSGEMQVPTFAGGTVRTEFEVLSGVPLAAFPGVEYPYFELVDAPMPGLMRTLAGQGYRTTVLHPNDAAFWNRRDALRNLGAQRFLALPAFAGAAKSGLFVSDEALTTRLLAELADDGPPQFLFAISIEAHGPYEVSPGLDADLLAAIPLPASLDEYGARTLRHFLYHAASADRELGRLAAFVRSRARPTLLLFYGDHLPGLHSTFAQLGFVDGRPARSQPVPYLIVDNRQAGAPRLEQTWSWMLPALLLEAARVPPDAYLALVAALRQSPATLLPAGAGGLPEARFVELARLRVRDEFDLGEYAAALQPPEAPPDAAGGALDSPLDEAGTEAATSL
jgi:Sulfatase